MASYFGYAGKMGPRTMRVSRTQDPMTTKNTMRSQGPMRTQDLMRTQDPIRTQDPRRTQTLGLRTLRGPGSYEDLGPCEDLEFFDDPGKT